ncbi:MAG: hypothetical protein QM760_02070 [Nibricoccus sp.]
MPLETRIGELRAWTEGKGKEPDNDELYATIVDWAEHDPEGALAWAQGARRLPQRLNLQALALTSLARKNLAGAQEWIRRNLDHHDRVFMLEQTFQGLAFESPRVALELIGAFPENEQPQNLGAALGALAGESPQEALVIFNRLSGENRENAAGWMLEAWAKKDAAAAMAWVEGKPDMIASPAARMAVLFECAQSRPDLALAFLKKFPETEDNYSNSHAIGLLLEHSPEHGVEALSLVSPATARSALTMWARESFEKSPERAVMLLKKWVSEETQRGVIREGFTAWLESDRRAAMEWLGTVTEPEMQTTLQAGLIGWEAQRDPVAALSVMSSSGVASPEMRDVVTQAFSSWAERDVAAAAGWVVANPALVTAEQASELTNRFLTKDEEGGADWLAKLPAGSTRDAAVEAAAIYWAERFEPELATQAAGTIRDPEKRTRALFSVYRAMRSSDAASAESWLVGAKDLSEETKQSWRAITSGR